MLKVLPFKIPKPEKEALVYQEDHERVFYDQLHQHEEIQISYIKAGRGSLILGDGITDYKERDVLVIGENIPHVFKSDPNASLKSVMLTLFFAKKSFGKEFFDLTDLKNLKELFEASRYGIKLVNNQEQVFKKLKKVKDQSKIQRIASLLEILDILIHSEKQALSSFVYQKTYTENEGKRMNAVFQYAMQHYREPITLDVIAAKANMSRNAFCRYFKKRTNKTFFQFLIEIRIEQACRLLYRSDETSVSAISERCGFQNIANFNRKFKKLKGVTPTEYRMQGD